MTTSNGSREPADEGGSWLRDTPGRVLELFRGRPQGLRKSDVVARTGLSRTAAAERVDALVAAGYLAQVRPPAEPGRGRPAGHYALNRARGVILVADTGITGWRFALCDAAGTVLAEKLEPLDITHGPQKVLATIDRRFAGLLNRHRTTPADVLGIGMSVPGPVDHATGRAISPPMMPGWHDFDIPGHFARTYAGPIVVEKDANAMAYGEFARVHPQVRDLVLVKLGTGIGTGLLLRGALYRGADGAAGDIGHVPVKHDGSDAPLCRCGNRGCVEAYAGGWALARDLTAAGVPTATVDGVIAAVRDGNRVALDLVRAAGATIGLALSDIVNLVNPRLIVFGGQFAALDEILLATVREVIYRRSLPLATRMLTVTSAGLPDPGVHGLAQLVTERVMAPNEVDRVVAGITAN